MLLHVANVVHVKLGRILVTQSSLTNVMSEIWRQDHVLGSVTIRIENSNNKYKLGWNYR